MTIIEVKNLQIEMEQEITELVKCFELRTGMIVTEFNVKSSEIMGVRGPRVYSITTKVELP